MGWPAAAFALAAVGDALWMTVSGSLSVASAAHACAGGAVVETVAGLLAPLIAPYPPDLTNSAMFLKPPAWQAGGSLAQVAWHREEASLARFDVADRFDDALVRNLPTGAVVLLYAPQSVFRVMGTQGEERLRPDVTFVPMPLLHYPNLPARLLARAPELRQLFAGIELTGDLREPDLQSLAAERPLYIELDGRVPVALYETLAPEGLYARVLPGGATDTDIQEGREAQQAVWAQLLLEAGPHLDPETRAQVLYRRFHDAMFLAAVGDREGARAAIDTVLLDLDGTRLFTHFPPADTYNVHIAPLIEC